MTVPVPSSTDQRSGAARPLATEVAVALSYNGSTEAVLMASPTDLIDFAYGFSLTEGLATPQQIERIEPLVTPLGIDLQIWVSEEVAGRLAARRRRRVGPVGCGLCGIETLAEAMRGLPQLPATPLRLSDTEAEAAVATLDAAQPLRDATRATHAAGFWTPAEGLVALREDVGRHNALDKLAGALRGRDPPAGAVVLTSRVSVDLVQKCVTLGAPLLLAVSAPTTAAVDAARAAGLMLAAPVRRGRVDWLSRGEG
ncbi:formate dehydrogenase accessory sulfurtransferase FdhD [Paracoccus suum]|uniref:Formate dehydrogenase accessory sulfurtransferase FdhD n=1 Tax=Paracoccus suum TaxID=2259340 RepID=A0A344PHR7_9RHOB|nr:formate dehydrogenase accessory sulfurtransferase FdhD [Paracoccus suum]AXC48922.1 formate dehydrogenase accessory sulfurtransferase FdhD [Paracoccus suum]